MCTHKCIFIFFVNKPRKIMFSTPLLGQKKRCANECFALLKGKSKRAKGAMRGWTWMPARPEAPLAVAETLAKGWKASQKPNPFSHFLYSAKGAFFYSFFAYFFAGQLSCSNLFVVGRGLNVAHNPFEIHLIFSWLHAPPFESFNSTFYSLMILVGI